MDVQDTNLIHDSTKRLFRDPPGAVACGTEVVLSLKADRLKVEHATLCVLRSEAIERIGMEAGGDFLYAVYITPWSENCAGYVLWYWFEVVIEGGAVCYYGAAPPYMSGAGRIYPNQPPAFQLTVFDAGFATPDWAKSAIMYQIFPDRFCMGDPETVRTGIEYHRGKGRAEIELHEDWGGLPVFEAKEGQRFYMPSDMFGGDLEGVRLRLPYLQSLGVTLIYLNPIFESGSNHRYNTGDYMKIDPILGDEEVFRRLVGEAKAMGMRVILDGVFSHTGDDSVYFNKYGRYDGPGAYQGPGSPYFSWYRFDAFPDRYESWWGFESLPEVNEFDPSWQEFVVSGPDSVVKHWLGAGAAGYRLDVADELPDETIELLRRAVKEKDPESFLLGEVWDDATTKQGYGRQRLYALGRGLDSVMNYPFLGRVIDFLTGRIDAWHFSRFLEHQRHNYPAPMYYALMNLLSSHDVCRIRSVLSASSPGFDPGEMSRAEQAGFSLSEEEYALGGKRQRLAAAIQFSLPGIPAIYYGDEAGMTGLLDPFNRRPFACEDEAIVEWYRWLGRLRNSRPAMQTGYVRFFSTSMNVLGILRYTAGGRDFFGRELGADAILMVVNPTEEQRLIVLDLNDLDDMSGMGGMSGASGEGGMSGMSIEEGMIGMDASGRDGGASDKSGESGMGDMGYMNSASGEGGMGGMISERCMDSVSFEGGEGDIDSVSGRGDRMNSKFGQLADDPNEIAGPAETSEGIGADLAHASVAVNLRTGAETPVENKLVEIDVAPLSAELFELR